MYTFYCRNFHFDNFFSIKFLIQNVLASRFLFKVSYRLMSISYVYIICRSIYRSHISYVDLYIDLYISYVDLYISYDIYIIWYVYIICIICIYIYVYIICSFCSFVGICSFKFAAFVGKLFCTDLGIKNLPQNLVFFYCKNFNQCVIPLLIVDTHVNSIVPLAVGKI